jgi:hypothetical protein
MGEDITLFKKKKYVIQTFVQWYYVKGKGKVVPLL